MILAINTPGAHAHLSLLKNGSVSAQKNWESGRRLSSELLVAIEKLLRSEGGGWKDLSGVLVFEGPGSFTSLRIGITVANTIAYSQGVPIVGERGDKWLTKAQERIARGENDGQVVPYYGAEPHITRPKP